MLDNNAPRTMMLLGAALSGGDVMALAKKMVEKDLTNDQKCAKIVVEEQSSEEAAQP